MTMLARIAGLLGRRGPITFVGVGSVALSGSNSIGVPSGVREGDLLRIVGASGSTHTLTDSTGWNLLVAGVGGAQRPHEWWKIATASESANSVTATQSRMRFVMLAYRWTNPSSPIDVAGSSNNGTSTSPATTTLTTTAAEDLVSGFFCSEKSVTFTAPAGTTDRYNAAGDGTVNGLCIFDKIQSAIGATGALTGTASSSQAWSSFASSYKP